MDDSAFPKVVSQQSQPKRPKTLLILAVFLVLLGVLLFVGSQLLTTKNAEKKNSSPKVAPTAIIAPTDTPTPQESPTPTPGKKGAPSLTPSPTAKPASSSSSSLDKATGLDRSALSVTILNGSGVAGAASKMATLLKNAGYSIDSTGNADRFDYEGVTIQVKSSESKYLPLLKKDISASYTVTDTSTSLASSTADAAIIIGK